MATQEYVHDDDAMEEEMDGPFGLVRSDGVIGGQLHSSKSADKVESTLRTFAHMKLFRNHSPTTVTLKNIDINLLFNLSLLHDDSVSLMRIPFFHTPQLIPFSLLDLLEEDEGQRKEVLYQAVRRDRPKMVELLYEKELDFLDCHSYSNNPFDVDGFLYHLYTSGHYKMLLLCLKKCAPKLVWTFLLMDAFSNDELRRVLGVLDFVKIWQYTVKVKCQKTEVVHLIPYMHLDWQVCLPNCFAYNPRFHKFTSKQFQDIVKDWLHPMQCLRAEKRLHLGLENGQLVKRYPQGKTRCLDSHTKSKDWSIMLMLPRDLSIYIFGFLPVNWDAPQTVSTWRYMQERLRLKAVHKLQSFYRTFVYERSIHDYTRCSECNASVRYTDMARHWLHFCTREEEDTTLF